RANYANAIRRVADETVKGIKTKRGLAEILRRVRLPEELASLPYLHERYGVVRWAVQGILRQYTGWLDFAPVHLNPCPRRKFARALLQASGGARAFLARAQRGIEAGENQIVLDLTDVVLEIQPRHPRATALRLKALT